MDVILAVVCLGLLTIALLMAGVYFRIPSVVSFLVIGILAGPYALSILTDQATIETIGEIGVILLLFAIGLEFSLDKLSGAWRTVVIGGFLQLTTTIVAASGLMYFAKGLQFTEAIFFGFLVSLSSTAIVMKVLQERGEVETVSGRTLLGILIFQDLAIIPMILITPFLVGTGGTTTNSLLFQAAKVLGILAVLIVSARWIVPWILLRVTRQRNRELFIFTVAGICFAVAWLTNAAGLSYSLGAFAAGLIIGESEFSLDAVSNIIPFRDVFSAIFFISIGMLLDPSVFVTRSDIVFTLVAIILGVKVVTGSFAATVLGMPARVAIFVGLALAQIGEFSFVLANNALNTNLIGTGPYQTFLASAIITMALTPFTMNAAPVLTGLLHRIFPDRIPIENPEDKADNKSPDDLRGHLIIIGYGMTGRSVARAAEIAGIPFIAIDLDPDVVRMERKAGPVNHFIYGDATHEEILLHAGIGQARALVIAIPEHNVVPGIVHLARDLAPGCYIIVRTQHVTEVQHLLDLGADEVIPEEFGTSVQAFSTVLGKYALPEHDAALLADKIRANGNRMFTRSSHSPARADDMREPAGELNIHNLCITDRSWAEGRTLHELDAEGTRNVRILAVRRGTSMITTLQPDMKLGTGDCLVIHATGKNLEKFRSRVAGH